MDDTRRKDKRIGVSFLVTYRVLDPIQERLDFGEAERDAVAEDLSVGGLSLSTSHPVAEGVILAIKFRAISKSDKDGETSSQKFEIRGEARYSRHEKENFSYRIGLRFIKLSNEEIKFIKSCL